MKRFHIIHKWKYLGEYKWDYCGKAHEVDYNIQCYICTICGKYKYKAIPLTKVR